MGLVCGLLAVGGRQLDPRFAILALGILCIWASDTIYLIKAAQGTWVSGGPYDPGWWTISVCFAAAAWMPRRGRAVAVRERSLISVPIAFAMVSLAILVLGTTTAVTLPAVGLAAGALLSVLGRLVLTFRAHQAMLEHSRTEASTDPLTGLGNRRALAATLAHRLDQAQPPPMNPCPVRSRRLQELQRQLRARRRRRSAPALGDRALDGPQPPRRRLPRGRR
jgi:two-component system cell cycle response regulator